MTPSTTTVQYYIKDNGKAELCDHEVETGGTAKTFSYISQYFIKEEVQSDKQGIILTRSAP
ncbi:MAG: hypothetical protein GX922_04145 [Firmicutes bacterium]|nr:hypothetical protein [Bacillota bacterium]